MPASDEIVEDTSEQAEEELCLGEWHHGRGRSDGRSEGGGGRWEAQPVPVAKWRRDGSRRARPGRLRLGISSGALVGFAQSIGRSMAYHCTP